MRASPPTPTRSASAAWAEAQGMTTTDQQTPLPELPPATPPPPVEPAPWIHHLTLREIEAAGADLLPPGARAYYEGGAADEVTLRENQTAFDRWRIVPRMMVPTTERDQSVEVLG